MYEIGTIDAFTKWAEASEQPPAAFQNIDLLQMEKTLLEKTFQGSLFLGCDLSDAAVGHIVKTGGVIIPDDKDLAFQVHRPKVYSPKELFAGFDLKDPDGYKQTIDYKIYDQYLDQGKYQPTSIKTSMYRRLHDHAITDALEELLAGRQVVAVMGGHGMERGDDFYLKVAKVSRKLTIDGFLMVSGGGPGAMEATHLGAYFAMRPEKELEAAVAKIKVRPSDGKAGKEYADKDWLHRAFQVMEDYPLRSEDEEKCMSIGIPTWLYGHEPPAPFATHIAKYFANSVREEGLLAIAKHGVIFAPGSAGTTQEIFQDACQNHYMSFGGASPMILFGVKHWTENRPVWDLLIDVSKSKPYGELVALTDNDEEIIRRIKMFKPELYLKK